MSEEEKRGIKETLELVSALGLIATTAKKIAKDGLGVDDLVHLVDLGKQFDVLMDGFKDLDVLAEEIKDLDQDEVIQIIGALYSVVSKVNKA